MTKFEANTSYATRSICDHECIINVHVVRRTAKTVTLSDDERTNFQARGKTFRINEWNGKEQFKPWGSYSMAPRISADQAV